MWDGTHWEALFKGFDGAPVNLVGLPNGDVVAGSSIRTAPGGVAVRSVAYWNGRDWAPMGAGMSGGNGPFVAALAVLRTGDIVAGGEFANAGGTAVNNIARWDGAAWYPLGLGITSPGIPYVGNLAVQRNGDLVVAGSFATAGGTAANNIASWNGATWAALGAGVDGPQALAVLPNGDLIVGGGFSSVGGVANTSHVARWDGSNWWPLGIGVNGAVEALVVLPNGNLVAGGSFTTAGSVAALKIARWDGSTWSALGTGLAGRSAIVDAVVALVNGDIVASGSFDTAGGVPVNNVARWNGTAWAAVGPVGTGSLPRVYRVLAHVSGEIILSAGYCDAAAIHQCGFARFTDTNIPWVASHPSSVAAVCGQATAFTVAPATGYGNMAYVWRRNGAVLSASDQRLTVTSSDSGSTLTIVSLDAADAGVYDCVVSNTCGSATSAGAALAIDASTCCAAEYTMDGVLNSDDLGDYITDYFAAPPMAGPGGFAVPCPGNVPPYHLGYRAAFVPAGGWQCTLPDSDNLGDYITAYFTGC